MANTPVNIVYPIESGTYPITDPAASKLNSAYISLSFSATRGGGPYIVCWTVDGDQLGEAKFYDEISVQQVWKLPGGKHRFDVEMRQPGTAGMVLGSDQVTFIVGS
jgi:hypothetical protein